MDEDLERKGRQEEERELRARRNSQGLDWCPRCEEWVSIKYHSCFVLKWKAQ